MKALTPVLVAAAFAASSPVSAESLAPLTWMSCDAPGTLPADVAAQTECASLVVPRDYADPTAGTLVLPVVRVTAEGERGARHDGALLLEPDDFADAIDTAIPTMASKWLHGGDAWRSVRQRLDLVGLGQRHMAAADGHDCLSATGGLPRHAALGTDTTDANFVTAEGMALAIATACQNDPMHAHIGTLPRIEDMERLRVALGQPRLHLLGVGHGGWVTARYAERYPDRVGRMLLDSSWDIDGSVAEAVEARVDERGRTMRRAITEVVGTPARYGWGAVAADIHGHIGRLPAWAHAAWARHVVKVPDLLAVLGMGRLLERDTSLTVHGLRDALATARLSPLDEDDLAAHVSAGRLLDMADTAPHADPYGFGLDAAGHSPAHIASAFAARCNDGQWGTRQRYWRQRTRQLLDAWPSSVANETFQGMVCSAWPGRFGRSEVPVLDRAPLFLMVHAEFDDEAPLRNAVMGLHGHVNARMVVARGARAHGMTMRHDRPCVSTLTGRFLAGGVLPDAKLTNCSLPEPLAAP